MLLGDNFLSGGEEIGFNNSVFLSERDTADRNFALAYFMKENKCFPKGFNLQECLDFYFQVRNKRICNSFFNFAYNSDLLDGGEL